MRRALAITLLTATTFSLSCCSQGDRLVSSGLAQPRDVGEVSLPDVTEQGLSMTFAAPRHGVMLVYFGYASCTRYCPTTLADLATAVRELDPVQRSRVEIVMATVDPAHDSPDRAASYVHRFLPAARAVRTDDETRLRAVADAFGADYAVGTAPDGTPSVAIDAYVYVVDDHANVRTLWPYGTSSAQMLHDLRLLLAGVWP